VSYWLPAEGELCRRSSWSETPRELARRKRRVAKIIEIIGNVTPKSEVEEFIDFHDSTYFNEVRPGPFWIRSKRQKVAMNGLATALRRLKAALKQKDLISTLRSAFPMNESDLEKWCRRVEGIAATPLPNRGRINYAKRYAVQLTAEFLMCYDVELRNGRNSQFCRAAEALYGDGSKLYHYCRQYLSGQSRFRTRYQIVPQLT
jgi:hypothetical protein